MLVALAEVVDSRADSLSADYGGVSQQQIFERWLLVAEAEVAGSRFISSRISVVG